MGKYKFNIPTKSFIVNIDNCLISKQPNLTVSPWSHYIVCAGVKGEDK